jgi:hypothetical protein
MEPSRWWGDDRAILDDDEARRRLIEAASRCIVRRGNTQIRMNEVAVASRGPGMRDVAYFLCNSLPVHTRRAHQDALLSRYLAARAARGDSLDEATAREQYRLFSIYSWIAAISTAAMGSRWQPADVGYAAMVRTTEAIDDLDVIGLLHERSGTR